MKEFKHGQVVKRINNSFGDAIAGMTYVIVESNDLGRNLKVKDCGPNSKVHQFNYNAISFVLANQWKGKERGVTNEI